MTLIVVRAVILATLLAGAFSTWTDDGRAYTNPVTIFGSIAAFCLIVAGPQPRLATRWAWFWLSLPLSLGWAVFALVEPAMLVTGRPLLTRATRLTGGPAFLIAIVLGLVLNAAFPGLRPL